MGPVQPQRSYRSREVHGSVHPRNFLYVFFGFCWLRWWTLIPCAANADCALRALPEDQIPKEHDAASVLFNDEDVGFELDGHVQPGGVFGMITASVVPHSASYFISFSASPYPWPYPDLSDHAAQTNTTDTSSPTSTQITSKVTTLASFFPTNDTQFFSPKPSASTDLTFAADASPPTPTQFAQELTTPASFFLPNVQCSSSNPGAATTGLTSHLPSVLLGDEEDETPVPLKRKRMVLGDDEEDAEISTSAVPAITTPPTLTTLLSRPTTPIFRPTTLLAQPTTLGKLAAKPRVTTLPTSLHPNIQKALQSTSSVVPKPVARPVARPVANPTSPDLIPDWKNWPAHASAGFQWLIRDTESWGNWQSTARMFLNFRERTGFPVHVNI